MCMQMSPGKKMHAGYVCRSWTSMYGMHCVYRVHLYTYECKRAFVLNKYMCVSVHKVKPLKPRGYVCAWTNVVYKCRKKEKKVVRTRLSKC